MKSQTKTSYSVTDTNTPTIKDSPHKNVDSPPMEGKFHSLK